MLNSQQVWIQLPDLVHYVDNLVQAVFVLIILSHTE